jgi:hypothetical protein
MYFCIKPRLAGTPARSSLGFIHPVLVLAVVVSLASCSKNETTTSTPTSPGQDVSSPSDARAEPSAAPYKAGTKIGFGAGGNSEQYRVSGWSKTEADHTWTEGTHAILAFAALPSSEPLELRMTLAGLVKPPERPSQPVEVSANGKKIAEWQVADKQQFTATIPAGIIAPNGTLTLHFKIPKAVSPKSIELNADPRVLGICAFDLVIDKSN